MVIRYALLPLLRSDWTLNCGALNSIQSANVCTFEVWQSRSWEKRSSSTLRHHNRKQLWLTTKFHSFERLSLNNSSPEDAFSAYLLHSNLAATSCNFVNQELGKRLCLHPHPPSSTEPRDEVIPNFFCRHLAGEIDPPDPQTLMCTGNTFLDITHTFLVWRQKWILW